MNTHRYTPQLIVENKDYLCFNIPLYQRLFAWGESQVYGLLYDMKEHFGKTGKEEPYYLGMLSCIARGNEYDLIDGQQRFTVMTLLALVLRKYDERWNKFLDEGKRLHFVARPKDREYLLASIRNVVGQVDEPKKKCSPPSTWQRSLLKEISNPMRTDWFLQQMFLNVYHSFSLFFLMNT